MSTFLSSLALLALLAFFLRAPISLAARTHLRSYQARHRGRAWEPLHPGERAQLELACVNASKYGLIGSILGMMFMVSNQADPSHMLSGLGMMLSTTLLGGAVDIIATQALWLEENHAIRPGPHPQPEDDQELETSRVSYLIRSAQVVLVLASLGLLIALSQQPTSSEALSSRVSWTSYSETPGREPPASTQQLEPEPETQDPTPTEAAPDPEQRVPPEPTEPAAPTPTTSDTAQPAAGELGKQRVPAEEQPRAPEPDKRPRETAKPPPEPELEVVAKVAKRASQTTRKEDSPTQDPGGQDETDLELAATLELEGVTPKLQLHLTRAAIQALSPTLCDVEKQGSSRAQTWNVEETFKLEPNLRKIQRAYSTYTIREPVTPRIRQALESSGASSNSIRCRKYLPESLLRRLQDEAGQSPRETLVFDVDHHKKKWELELRGAKLEPSQQP